MKNLLTLLLLLPFFATAQTNTRIDNIAQMQYLMDSALLKKDTASLSRRIDSLMQNRLRAFDLGLVTVNQPGALIAAGPRYHTITGIAGLLATDLVQLYPTTDLPSGYILGDYRVTAAGSIKLNLSGPALVVLGPGYSFTCRVVALRPVVP